MIMMTKKFVFTGYRFQFCHLKQSILDQHTLQSKLRINGILKDSVRVL